MWAVPESLARRVPAGLQGFTGLLARISPLAGVADACENALVLRGGSTVAELAATELAELEEAGRVVQVGTHRRVSPHNVSGQEFIRNGKAGADGRRGIRAVQ